MDQGLRCLFHVSFLHQTLNAFARVTRYSLAFLRCRRGWKWLWMKAWVLLLDHAGWHRTGGKLRVPDNISLLYLPPYSPDLNPF
jgi:hypothetical protein